MSRNPQQIELRQGGTYPPLTLLQVLRARAPESTHCLIEERTAKRELQVLFLWHWGHLKSTARLRSFDSGWAVWDIPAELATYSDQKLKTAHHLSGLWFGRSLNDFILSGEPGSILNPTHLAGIFLFFGLQCFQVSKE